jgi:hypothetical protein
MKIRHTQNFRGVTWTKCAMIQFFTNLLSHLPDITNQNAQLSNDNDMSCCRSSYYYMHDMHRMALTHTDAMWKHKDVHKSRILSIHFITFCKIVLKRV